MYILFMNKNPKEKLIIYKLYVAICKEPVDIGHCRGEGGHKRFFYDEDSQTCRAFIFSGCGGNRNNFKTFESCINTCYRSK